MPCKREHAAAADMRYRLVGGEDPVRARRRPQFVDIADIGYPSGRVALREVRVLC
jgi:hypothetical protein